MTQVFDNTIATEKDWVRFQIGDTNSDGMYIDDETINYFIDLNSKEQAVIDSLKYIITQLSAPNTKIDWLTVSYQDAREGYEKMLADKKKELGINSISFSTNNNTVWRADSDQTDGDYEL